MSVISWRTTQLYQYQIFGCIVVILALFLLVESHFYTTTTANLTSVSNLSFVISYLVLGFGMCLNGKNQPALGSLLCSIPLILNLAFLFVIGMETNGFSSETAKLKASLGPAAIQSYVPVAVSIGLVLTSLGFILINFERKANLGYFLISISFGLGIVSIVSKFSQLEVSTLWRHFILMPTTDSFIFTLIGATALSSYHQNLRLVNSSKNFLKVLFIDVPLTLVFITIWQALVTVEDKDISARVQNTANRMHESFQLRLDSLLKAQMRMAGRFSRNEDIIESEWNADATEYINDIKSYHAIEWVNSDYFVQWVVPLEGNESILGVNIAFGKARKRALDKARDLERYAISETINLIQGGRGVLVYAPIYSKSSATERSTSHDLSTKPQLSNSSEYDNTNETKVFRGFIAGVIKIETFLTDLLEPSQFKKNYSVNVLEKQESIFQVNSENASDNDMYMTEIRVSIDDLNLALEFRPTKNFVTSEHTPLPTAILILGFSVILGLHFIFYLYQQAMIRSRELKKRG